MWQYSAQSEIKREWLLPWPVESGERGILGLGQQVAVLWGQRSLQLVCGAGLPAPPLPPRCPSQPGLSSTCALSEASFPDCPLPSWTSVLAHTSGQYKWWLKGNRLELRDMEGYNKDTIILSKWHTYEWVRTMLALSHRLVSLRWHTRS